MQTFTFFLDFQICGQFTGLCWALEKGLYRDAGLNVELVPWIEDGRSITDRVLQHSGLCAGCSEDNLIISACAAGQPAKALGTMLHTSPLVLMTRRSSSIRSLNDLAGKRVAMHCDGIRILEGVLALQEIDQTQIHIEELPFDIERLVQGDFDAVQGYVTSEPLELKARGIDVHTIAVRHHELHPYAQVFFAAQHNIEECRPEMEAFFRASFSGWRQAMQDRDEAARVVAHLAGNHADVDMERRIIEAIDGHLTGLGGMDCYGMLDLERWERNLGTYARFGIVPRQMTVIDTVDTSFLKTIYPDC
jgi:ABC-type nitrate/sulfonate/bicarbonate transport system substrate-binding protein